MGAHARGTRTARHLVGGGTVNGEMSSSASLWVTQRLGTA